MSIRAKLHGKLPMSHENLTLQIGQCSSVSEYKQFLHSEWPHDRTMGVCVSEALHVVEYASKQHGQDIFNQLAYKNGAIISLQGMLLWANIHYNSQGKYVHNHLTNFNISFLESPGSTILKTKCNTFPVPVRNSMVYNY
jgi:hypothetical protein